jgi:hypothetical protein
MIVIYRKTIFTQWQAMDRTSWNAHRQVANLGTAETSRYRLLRRDPDVRGHSKRGLPSLLDRLATLARAREQDGRHD